MASGVRSGADARAVRLIFLMVGGVAIWRQAGTIHWSAVGPLLGSYRWPQLGLAIGLSLDPHAQFERLRSEGSSIAFAIGSAGAMSRSRGA